MARVKNLSAGQLPKATSTEAGTSAKSSAINVEMQYCCGDEGRAYYTKAHVPLDDFMVALRSEVGDVDPILREEPTHCWMRVCRDFDNGHSILIEAKPNSRGAFRATWIQDA